MAQEDSLLGSCWLLLVSAEFIARACCSLFPLRLGSFVERSPVVGCDCHSSCQCWPRHRQEQGDLRWMKQHQCWQHCYWCSTLVVTGWWVNFIAIHGNILILIPAKKENALYPQGCPCWPLLIDWDASVKRHIGISQQKQRTSPGKMAITDCYSIVNGTITLGVPTYDLTVTDYLFQ